LAQAEAPSKSPVPAAAPDSKIPRLAGSVGQLEEGNEFLAFIHTHEHQTVALDLQFPGGDFQGGDEADSSSFAVWEECDNLPEGQKPGVLSGGCTGFQFIVPYEHGTPRILTQDGGVWRLRGQFRVEPAGGPLQGLMVVKLTPVARASGGNGR
jgi:hypothetical protein